MVRAWWLACWCAAAACGRVGFSPLDGASGQPTWPYRQALVVDHAKVAGDLASFPVLVELDGDAALEAHLVNQRIAFTDAADQPLAFELEALAPDGSSLTAWVQVPALSASSDTTIYLYYGNGAVPDQARPAEVWSNRFAGVYHFGDGATLDAHDSIGVNDGAVQGATATAGQIRGAAAFDGSTQIEVPTRGVDTTAGAANTVTFWLYYMPPYNTMPVAFLDVGSTSTYDLWFESDGCEGFNTETCSRRAPPGSPGAGSTWRRCSTTARRWRRATRSTSTASPRACPRRAGRPRRAPARPTRSSSGVASWAARTTA
jgi:hypothetical protein